MLACNPASPWPREAVEAAAASRKRKGHQPKKKNQLSDNEGMDFRRWLEPQWKKAKRKLLPSSSDDPVAEEPEHPEPPTKSAKTKLFDIIQEDKETKKGFFSRGIFDSVRSSFRKIRPKPEPLEDLEPLKLELFNGSTESQDSGLGEDSDLDVSGLSGLTSPRTPVSAPESLRTPTPCILKSSSAHSVKKHVIIREPSLSKLPSVARRRRQPRMERVRIVHGPSKPSEPQEVGNVANQWCQLYQAAYNEVYQTVPGCDNFTVKLLFDVNPLSVRRDLEAMTSAEVSIVIHTIYKILYFDWTGRGLLQNLPMIVHCIQRFLLVVLEVCEELEADDRARFSRLFRDLLRSSEAGLYSDLGNCLDRTRRAYIQLWTSLLCTDMTVVGGEDELQCEMAKNRASINALQVK